MDNPVSLAKRALESSKTEIQAHSAVFINSKEWAVYMHMKIHMDMTSAVEGAPSLMIGDSRDVVIQKTFPPDMMPTLDDIVEYVQKAEVKSLIEDAMKKKESQDLLAKWLNVCTACARNKSKYLCYFPTTMYKLTRESIASKILDSSTYQSIYARMFRWDIFHPAGITKTPVLLAFDATWGKANEEPVVNVYWKSFSTPEETVNTKNIETYAKKEARKMCFVREHMDMVIVDTHSMQEITMSEFIACILTAESLPRGYEHYEVERIYRYYIKKVLGERKDEKDQWEAIRSILYRNEPLVSLTEHTLQTRPRPPELYSPLLSEEEFRKTFRST